MLNPPRPVLSSTRALLAGAAVFATCSAASATWLDVIAVQSARVSLRSGKDNTYKVVAYALKDEKLEVVTPADNKGWTLFKRTVATAEQGYALKSSLEPPLAPKSNDGFRNMLSGSSDRSQVTAAAAAKGIEPQTVAYANAKGYRTDGLDQLRRRRDAIDHAEFEQFRASLRPTN